VLFIGKMQRRFPGDWDCVQCGELNFASRNKCRKCNSGRPEEGTPTDEGAEGFTGGGSFGGDFAGGGFPGGGMGGGFPGGGVSGGFGAWQVRGGHHDVKPGDWYCPNCSDLNFASREFCRKCSTPHPPFSDPTVGTKPGDWYCPTCGDLNFASRLVCRKCATPHPGGGMDPSVRAMMSQTYSNVKPGDWHCPNCHDLNFASRTLCRLCGTPRAEDQQILGIKPGDWFCPNVACNDLNFASRSTCRKCGTPRPSSVVTTAAPDGDAPTSDGPPRSNDWVADY